MEVGDQATQGCACSVSQGKVPVARRSVSTFLKKKKWTPDQARGDVNRSGVTEWQVLGDGVGIPEYIFRFNLACFQTLREVPLTQYIVFFLS